MAKAGVLSVTDDTDGTIIVKDMITRWLKAMTNRQWLIWQLIDMTDEEFAEGICGNGELWSCDDCRIHGVNDCGCDGCEEKFHAWLKQEHKEHGNEL